MAESTQSYIYVKGNKEFLVDRILVFDVKGKCERRVQIQCV